MSVDGPTDEISDVDIEAILTYMSSASEYEDTSDKDDIVSTVIANHSASSTVPEIDFSLPLLFEEKANHVSVDSMTNKSTLSSPAPLIFLFEENPKKRKRNSQRQCLFEKSEQPENEIDNKILFTIDSLKELYQAVDDDAIKKHLGIDQATLAASTARLKKNGYLLEDITCWYRITKNGKGHIETLKSVSSVLPVAPEKPFPLPTLTPRVPLIFKFHNQGQKVEQPENEIDDEILFVIDALKDLHRAVDDDSIRIRLNIDQTILDASKERLKKSGYLPKYGKSWHKITAKGKERIKALKDGGKQLSVKRKKRSAIK